MQLSTPTMDQINPCAERPLFLPVHARPRTHYANWATAPSRRRGQLQCMGLCLRIRSGMMAHLLLLEELPAYVRSKAQIRLVATTAAADTGAVGMSMSRASRVAR